MAGAALEPLLRHVYRATGETRPTDADLLARIRDRRDQDTLYTPSEGGQLILAQREYRLDIELTPARTVTVLFFDPDAKPLAGCYVDVLHVNPYYGMAVSGVERGNSLPVTGVDPRRPRTLYLQHAGRKLAGTATIRGDEDGPVRVMLQPWATLTGRSTDLDGQPWVGAFVSPS